MKKTLYLFIVATILFGKGHATTDAYRFGDTVIAFKQVGDLWINRSCNPPDCEALKKAPENDQTQLDPKLLRGGVNPFSVRCKTVLKGEVLVGKDLKGNEMAFCRFNDDSYLR